MLRAYERLAPDLEFTHYDRVAALPHFNPDLDGDGTVLPAEVSKLRTSVNRADVMVVSTPEYVHALPGSFKNALDWLVSDPMFAGKRVAILHVDRGSSWALASLQEVLRTMNARILDTAFVALPLGTNLVDEAAILARDDLRRLLSGSIEVLRAALQQEPNQPA